MSHEQWSALLYVKKWPNINDCASIDQENGVCKISKNQDHMFKTHKRVEQLTSSKGVQISKITKHWYTTVSYQTSYKNQDHVYVSKSMLYENWSTH
jgi:hypothetical protein